MSVPLWALAVLMPELVLTCLLLRWLPVKQERWLPAVPLPVIVVMALILRFVGQVPWTVTLAGCTGFLWGCVLALVPFRGWVSSWTLPVGGRARLRWREAVLAVPAVLTPLATRRTDAAMEKAFAVRQVVQGRGRFPPAMGLALLVVPVVCAVGAARAADVLGWV
jgi:hypothetical protein